MLLILAQLMVSLLFFHTQKKNEHPTNAPQGIYLLSTIVQLRTCFPPLPTRPDIDAAEVNLFSTIPEYELFGSLFDVSFLVAAGVSSLARWASGIVTGIGDYV
jgi:hypothetical protein